MKAEDPFFFAHKPGEKVLRRIRIEHDRLRQDMLPP
jgi:hypothetical protein